MSKIPDTDHELLRQAVGDLAKCEQDPLYRVDMAEWHEQVTDAGCCVNLVGAVMAKTFHASPDTPTCALRIPARVRRLSVYQHGCSPDSYARWRRDLADYEDDPASFKRGLMQMADDMEAEAKGGPCAFVS